MGLFRKSPPPRPALHRRVPRPWDPPETEFPAIVPISTLQFGRSAQTATAITAMSAYSNGFEVFVTRLIRPDVPGFDEDPVPGAPGGMLADRQSFQISLQLSDGRMVTSGGQYGDAEPAGPILRSRAPPIAAINGLVPAGSKRPDNTGLPSPGHASQQHPLHGREPTATDIAAGHQVRIGVSDATKGRCCSPSGCGRVRQGAWRT